MRKLQGVALVAGAVAALVVPVAVAIAPAAKARGGDVRVVELVGVGRAGVVPVTVKPGDASLLFVAQGSGPDDRVVIRDVTMPDGAPLPDDLISEPVTFGENALLLPLVRDEPIQPGTYRFSVAARTGVRRAYAVLKSGNVERRQVLDVRFWVASRSGRLDAPAQRTAVAKRFRTVGQRLFSKQRLGVGTITFIDAPAAIRRRFSLLRLPSSGIDGMQRRLCLAMSRQVGPARALDFVIVDRILDPEDPEGETEGNSAGVPGAVMVENSSTSCVVVIADGERDILRLATTVWHEAGHLLGLMHTTEDDGEIFDYVADTPECDAGRFDRDGDGYLSEAECARADGRNFMFHDSDGLGITAGQAFVLRRNPLFHPVSR